MKNNNKICIVIPAYNEQDCIGITLKKLKEIGSFHTVVVDDGSTDGTALKAKTFGVHLIKLKKNSGAGAAFKAGMAYAFQKGFDFVIQLDADGQHNPKDINKLVQTMQSQNLDMVLGSRYVQQTSYKTPLLRLIAIRFFSSLIWFKLGVKIYDSTSGYRLINREVMQFILESKWQHHQETLVLTRLLQNGFRIGEVSVTMHKRAGGHSKLTFWKGVTCLFANTWMIVMSRPIVVKPAEIESA